MLGISPFYLVNCMSYNKSDGLFQVDIFKVNVGRVKILDKFDTGNRKIGALRL